MKWTTIEEGYPERDCVAYVCNSRHSAVAWIVIYDAQRKTFTHYNPEHWDHPPIEVTHWIELPVLPQFNFGPTPGDK